MTVTPVAGQTHHVTFEVNGSKMGFMIQPGSYGDERADDFAPRIASGNDTATRQGLWDSWSQSGLTEGIDQREYASSAKFWHSDGNIFPDRDKAIMLNSAWNSSDAAVAATAPQIKDFLTDLVLVGVGTKVRRYSVAGGTWAASTTTLAANVIALHTHGTKAYAAVSGSNEFYVSTDGDTWTQSTTTPASQPATCFATWEVAGGTVYLVIATANTIKLSTDDGVVFGSAISIGDASSDITAMTTGFGVLLIRKTDGVYWYNGTSVQEVWKHPNTKYAGNKCLCYHEGFLYVNELAKVHKLAFSDGNISNFVDATPYMDGDDDKVLYGHGIPVHMWSGNGRLYAAFDDGESVYPEVLYMTPTGSWQQAYRGTSGDTMNAGGYSQLAARTFINDGATRDRRHTTLANTPFPAFPTSGQFITSRFLGGQPFMNKTYRDISLEARNLSSGDGRQITVEYSLDKGTTYTTLGTMNTDGRTEFQFDNSDGSISNIDLMLRFTLTRGSTTTESPVLERFAVSFLLSPNPIYAYSSTVKVGPEMMLLDGTKETVTPSEQLDFLRLIESGDSVVRFVDDIGTHHLVKVSKTRTRQNVIETEADRDTRLVDVVMIDAVSGLWPQMEMELEWEITSIEFTLSDYVAAVWDTPTWDFFQWE